MTMYYILEGQTPVAVSDVLEWAEWYEEADRTVKKTRVGDVEVSTVFTGLDLFSRGPPLLFQTVVFGGERSGDKWRYNTWEEAEAGHDRVVAEIEGARQ